ncbi:MAG: hypothetical protein U0931_28740 [Vulcanimicrobiota bacterium]
MRRDQRDGLRRLGVSPSTQDCDILLEPDGDERFLMQLSQDDDSRLLGALVAEQLYLQQLDKLRAQTYQKAVRPYSAAVRESLDREMDLTEQQALRVRLAEVHLPVNPLSLLGFDSFIERAKAAVAEVVQPNLLKFLPDARPVYGGFFD